jgi:hypothetical protein
LGADEEKNIGILARERVQSTDFAEYIINIFQAFDLSLFLASRPQGQYQFPTSSDDLMAAFLMRVCRDFTQTTIELNF